MSDEETTSAEQPKSDGPLPTLDDLAKKITKSAAEKDKAVEKTVKGDGKARADDGKFSGNAPKDDRRGKPDPVTPSEIEEADEAADLERAKKVLEAKPTDPKPKPKPKAIEKPKSPAEAVADAPEPESDPEEPPGDIPTDEDDDPEPEPKEKPRSRLEDAKVFAALKKRERAALEAESRAKVEKEDAVRRAQHFEQELTKKHQAIESRAQQLQRHEQELEKDRSNPVAWLRRAGYTLDDAVSQIVNDGTPPAGKLTRDTEERLASHLRQLNAQWEQRFEAERQSREQERQERLQLQQRAQAEAERRALSEFSERVDSHIIDNPDKYEFILAEDQQGEVLRLIELSFEKTGKIMPITEAAEKVETFLKERYERLSKKFNGRQAPAPEQASSKQDRTDAKASSASKTLTNSRVASPGAGDSELPMNKDEALEFLAKKLNAGRKK